MGGVFKVLLFGLHLFSGVKMQHLLHRLLPVLVRVFFFLGLSVC